MNEKFFNLPEEKQLKIINAGYRVFSQDSYKKAPMNEIAEIAGISKSLLFFYFHNKKELYLYLWDNATEVTKQYLTEYHCYEPGDLFEMMERTMRAKFKMMEIYPYMSQFTIRAFYEKDKSVCSEIQSSFCKWMEIKSEIALGSLNPDEFIDGLDLKMMYREMYLAAEGYLWELSQQNKFDVAEMEKDFEKLIDFWKSIYKKKA